jgi:hypothetical protein
VLQADDGEPADVALDALVFSSPGRAFTSVCVAGVVVASDC